jgi:hypothetical protein
MVSVTMSDAPSPPAYNPSSGLLNFEVGPGKIALQKQIDAYYEANFRARQMETFADFVLEKGYGAYSPNPVRNKHGERVRETWQQCGRRLFGERFVAVMERKVTEYRAQHATGASSAAPEPPPHILEEIPEPDF